jgi:hypothetical protein
MAIAIIATDSYAYKIFCASAMSSNNSHALAWDPFLFNSFSCCHIHQYEIKIKKEQLKNDGSLIYVSIIDVITTLVHTFINTNIDISKTKRDDHSLYINHVSLENIIIKVKIQNILFNIKYAFLRFKAKSFY